MKISIVIPSLNRSHQLLTLIGNIQATSGKDFSIEILPIIDVDDLTTKSLLDKTGIKYYLTPPFSTPIFKWNEGLRHSSGDWIVQGADDILFPEDWLKKAFLTPNHGFLALSDGRMKDVPYEPHYMAERTWLKKYMGGVLACPKYNHYFNDLEIGARANKIGQFIRARIIIQHNHCVWNTAKKDSTYKKGEKFFNLDRVLYDERKQLNFPDDFSSVI